MRFLPDGILMRVLHVIESTLGGTRRFLEDIFDARAECDDALAFATERADAGFDRLLARIRGSRWTTYPLDLTRPVAPARDAAGIVALRRIVRHAAPDVIHAHSSKAGAVSRFANATLRRRVALVYSPHAVAAHMGRVYLAIERVLAPFADVFAAVSPSERAEIAALGLASGTRIAVLVPTIRPDRFVSGDRAAARRALAIADGPLVVGIGRLVPQKDPLAFVEAVSRLAAHVQGVRAIWVGDGDLRGAVEQAIDVHGLRERVTIAGWCEDVRPYLAACDVFLSTSAYESFGYVTAEAFAMDRPVVASRITGTVDVVVHDRDRVLYPRGDADAAARAVAALLADGDSASRIAARGRAHVLETYSPQATRRALDEAYAAALARRGAAR